MIQKIDCRFLIGLPGSGKTTYRNAFLAEHSNYVVISTDDMIERFATFNDITYNDAWHVLDLKQLEMEAKLTFAYAVTDLKPIIVDRTNLSQSVRRMFSCLLNDDYKRTAVVFSPTDLLLQERLRNREKTGKIIPINVMQFMRERYSEPTSQEFDEIIKIEGI